MRKEAKNAIAVNMASQQCYHNRNYIGESYAMQGFEKNAYWASDRPVWLDANWNRPDGKPLQGYGLEIEMECNSINDVDVLVEVLESVALKHFPKNLFKHQHDGSLGGRSSDEAITGVMTKAFIRNNYRAFKAMFDYFGKMDISCSRTGSCGMHVNISNALLGKTPESIADNAKKLLYFVNHHYSFCVSLFARNPQHTHYCGRMVRYMSKENCKAADLRYMPNEHSNCCNWSHFNAGRIELRLVGGQKDFPCFRNTMESVFHIVSAMNRLSWDDIDDLTKVFKGCNQYVFDRLTRCRNEGVLSDAIVNAVQPTVKREDLI